MAVPAFTPLTVPFALLIAATNGLLEDHAPPFTEEVRVEEPFAQIAVVPEIVPAVGGAVTVTRMVCVAFAQPPVPVTVYVINDVPALKPVTAPVEALMLATAGVAEDHAPPVIFDDKVDVPFSQIACVPVRLPAEGTGVTVTVAVAETLAQPPMPVIR